jgi:hypothetical protein
MTAVQYFPDNGELEFVPDCFIDLPLPVIDWTAVAVSARTKRAVAIGQALEARAKKNFTIVGYRLEEARQHGRVEHLLRPHA